MGSMLCGVSTRSYDELLEDFTGSTGLSKSSVSRAFIQWNENIFSRAQKKHLAIKSGCGVNDDHHSLSTNPTEIWDNFIRRRVV